jgi:suppressor for copper-sensitivity B
MGQRRDGRADKAFYRVSVNPIAKGIDPLQSAQPSIGRYLLWWARLLATVVSLAGLPDSARAAATAWVGDEHAAARLVTAVTETGSSSAIDAGLEIRMVPGWHAYWRDPGDAGLSPTVNWEKSTNLARAEIAWPAPTRLSAQGIETYVYPDHVLLPVAVALSEPGRPLALRASVDYAACAEVCVPYHADFSLALPAGFVVPSDEAPLIAAARAKVPGSLEAVGLALVAVGARPAGDKGANLTVRLRSTGAPLHQPDLFIEGLGQGRAGRPEVALTGAGRTVVLTAPISGYTAAALTGVPVTFTITDGAERAAEFVATPVLGAATKTTPYVALLAIALLGGLILNLMPCVLPVLSLKLLSVARLAGAHRGAARLSLLATAAGILASFAVLASMVIVLKMAGATIGWGIQFQQPWFLAGMAVVTALFAASLRGWLAINLPGPVYGVAAHQAHRPLVNAFLTGAFVTLLATPCSAPFVGTAVGFALASGPVDIAWTFAALSLGLASPYLLVAATPGLVGLLPKPGRWMLWLRRFLELLLAGTAVWLISVLAEEAGAGAAAATSLFLLAALAVIAWRAQLSLRSRLRPIAAALAASLGAAAIIVPQLEARPAPNIRPVAQVWRPFDTAEITRQVAAGKVVFVDVTAAWCLTCKVNEAVVLDREPVASRLRRPDVIAVRADWTRPDPEITGYLQSFGRYGIPLNVVYGPGLPEGFALSELLTTPMVMDALDRAATDRGVAQQSR